MNSLQMNALWKSPKDRRQFVRSAVGSSMLLSGILGQLMADEGSKLGPDSPIKTPHFPGKAKRVIFLFMTGGVSHVDTFDPKPALTRDHGKEIQADHPEIKDRPGYEKIFLKRPQWDFSKHGQCGTEVSTLFPHVATCVDDIALIRSMHTGHSNHYKLDAHGALEPLQRNARNAYRFLHAIQTESWFLGNLRARFGK